MPDMLSYVQWWILGLRGICNSLEMLASDGIFASPDATTTLEQYADRLATFAAASRVKNGMPPREAKQ